MGLKYNLPYVHGIFVIEVGKSVTDLALETDIYLIKNTETGVIEAETSSLARAILLAQANQDVLNHLDLDTNDNDSYRAFEAMLDNAEGNDIKKH